MKDNKYIIEKFKVIIERQKRYSDIEGDHSEADNLLLDLADNLLLDFINDPEIRTLYDEINKWYA